MDLKGAIMVNNQNFLNSINQNIDMVKGDTLAFNFQIQGLNGDEATFKFTVKEHPDEEILFAANLEDGISLVDYDALKDIATYSVHISPENTKGLALGRYYYDLEMQVNTDVLTLMRGRLTLLYEIS